MGSSSPAKPTRYSETASARYRFHRWRITCRPLPIIACVVVFGILLQIAWHYRFHLMWLYEVRHLGLEGVQAIPDRPMPHSPTPDGWVPCRVGGLELSLPPELANDRLAQNNSSSPVTFQNGSRVVVVALPRAASEYSGLLKAASELCPRSQSFTMPKLRRACYQASSDDFRWSMTPKEVRWHTFCITTGQLMRFSSGGHTESFSRGNLEGIIHFTGERAVCEWESRDSGLGGYIHFIDRGVKADATWIRAVCQSLRALKEAEAESR